MLERQTASNGVVYYLSPLLRAAKVRHAFSTRLGGISRAPFDSLNLGNPNGCEIQDDYDRIWDNYRRLLSAIDCPTSSALRVHQVHGNVVLTVAVGKSFDTHSKADAIVSTDATRPVSIRVADCVPVLLASTDGKTVAAVHAGWRGVVAGVVPAAVAELRSQAGGKSVSVLAAIGPCIGKESFEVGAEVLDVFQNEFANDPPIIRNSNGKGWVDLRAAIRQQLLSVDVAADCIDDTDRCTHRDAEEFFSHRRDRGITGRMAAVICPSIA